jgi:hypothetical protein
MNLTELRTFLTIIEAGRTRYTAPGRFGMNDQSSVAAQGSLRQSLLTSSKPARNRDFA